MLAVDALADALLAEVVAAACHVTARDHVEADRAGKEFQHLVDLCVYLVFFCKVVCVCEGVVGNFDVS